MRFGKLKLAAQYSYEAMRFMLSLQCKGMNVEGSITISTEHTMGVMRC